jgi:hypothetical protein
MHDLVINENGDILCPVCGFDYLHLVKVNSHDESASLTFWCEGCHMHGDQRLNFDNYKGRTTVAWEEGNNLGPVPVNI